MQKWDVYTITADNIVGVMFRGRIRKLCLEKDVDVLLENAADVQGAVRYAVHSGFDDKLIREYVSSIAPDAKIDLSLEAVCNPILSKLKNNVESRYTL